MDRPICKKCDKNLVHKIGNKANGEPKYRTVCYSCSLSPERKEAKNKRVRTKTPAHRKSLRENCEECGFVPVHTCQLAIDHVDGDHSNNDPDNYRTLCHNCHALKTYLNREWRPRAERFPQTS